jgi:hypothetical protein
METSSHYLTSETREELLRRHKQERDKRVADRIKSVLLWDEGWTSEQIASALFIDRTTVARYIKAYEEDENLSPRHKGSQPILTAEETQALSEHIESTCYTKVK